MPKGGLAEQQNTIATEPRRHREGCGCFLSVPLALNAGIEMAKSPTILGPASGERCFPERELTERIIGSAIAVHKALGPGFLESVYEKALAHELAKQGLRFERQETTKVLYDGVVCGEHRLDFLVEERVVVELKHVKPSLAPLRRARGVAERRNMVLDSRRGGSSRHRAGCPSVACGDAGSATLKNPREPVPGVRRWLWRRIPTARRGACHW